LTNFDISLFKKFNLAKNALCSFEPRPSIVAVVIARALAITPRSVEEISAQFVMQRKDKRTLRSIPDVVKKVTLRKVTLQ